MRIKARARAQQQQNSTSNFSKMDNQNYLVSRLRRQRRQNRLTLILGRASNRIVTPSHHHQRPRIHNITTIIPINFLPNHRILAITSTIILRIFHQSCSKHHHSLRLHNSNSCHNQQRRLSSHRWRHSSNPPQIVTTTRITRTILLTPQMRWTHTCNNLHYHCSNKLPSTDCWIKPIQSCISTPTAAASTAIISMASKHPTIIIR